MWEATDAWLLLLQLLDGFPPAHRPTMLCTLGLAPEVLPASVLRVLGPQGLHVACGGAVEEASAAERALLQRGACAAAAQAVDALPAAVAAALRCAASGCEGTVDGAADRQQVDSSAQGTARTIERKDSLNAAEMQEALRLQSTVRAEVVL